MKKPDTMRLEPVETPTNPTAPALWIDLDGWFNVLVDPGDTVVLRVAGEPKTVTATLLPGDRHWRVEVG